MSKTTYQCVETDCLFWTDDLQKLVDHVQTHGQQQPPPKLETITWAAIIRISFFVAFAPAIIWGLLITWLTWQVTDHPTAIASGMVAFGVSLYSGAWLALVLQLMPSDWIKGTR